LQDLWISVVLSKKDLWISVVLGKKDLWISAKRQYEVIDIKQITANSEKKLTVIDEKIFGN